MGPGPDRGWWAAITDLSRALRVGLRGRGSCGGSTPTRLTWWTARPNQRTAIAELARTTDVPRDAVANPIRTPDADTDGNAVYTRANTIVLLQLRAATATLAASLYSSASADRSRRATGDRVRPARASSSAGLAGWFDCHDWKRRLHPTDQVSRNCVCATIDQPAASYSSATTTGRQRVRASCCGVAGGIGPRACAAARPTPSRKPRGAAGFEPVLAHRTARAHMRGKAREPPANASVTNAPRRCPVGTSRQLRGHRRARSQTSPLTPTVSDTHCSVTMTGPRPGTGSVETPFTPAGANRADLSSPGLVEAQVRSPDRCCRAKVRSRPGRRLWTGAGEGCSTLR
jgi:hypothetical protein